MEPVLQRLGDVTIQRLERPKDPKQDQPSANSNQEKAQKPAEENEDSDELYPTDEESFEESDEGESHYNPIIPKHLPPVKPAQDLKRAFPPCGLNLGPEISFKKFKTEDKPAPQPKSIPKPTENPSNHPLSSLLKNEKPANANTPPVNFEDEDEHNLSDDDLSYYDSDLESEGELQDLGSDLGLSLNAGEGPKNAETKTQANSSHSVKSTVDPIIPQSFTADSNPEEILGAKSTKPSVSRPAKAPLVSNDDEEEEEGSNGEEESFFERLVEQADVPPPTPSTPSVKNESTDEDYEVDIKEKLKEMGEITFASVKKGEKPKSAENPSENEVVITKKSGEEVSLMSKFNMRRNIREVMDETKLDETTLAAQRQEAERLKRVQEQQRILREYQRQAQQERMQQRVMSLLQGDGFPKPGPSNQTRIGNTVLVKLPNGQTKPMTKVPKPPFDMLKMPRPESPHLRYPHPSQMMGPMGPMGHMGAPRGYPRGAMHHRRNSGVQLPSSLSFSPVSKRGPPLIPTRFPHSDSDSDGEERKRDAFGKPPKEKRDNQTIEVSSDDDCIVVSESEADQVEEEDHDDPSNSGMHTNDEFNQPDDQGRVLVNVGHAEDEPDVFVAPQIARIIKPHQIGGVRFLYDNIVESITRFDSSAGFGCILAHSMGLGKTLQIVTFSDVFLRYTPARTILCIMPINTLQNWMAEYNMWTPTAETAANSPLNANGEVRPRNFHLLVLNDSHKSLVARQKVIHQWQTQGGVLLIGYEQFRLLSMKKNPKTKRKAMAAPDVPDDSKNKHIFDEIYTALVNPGPDLVICDEGHRIKNSHASISTALKQLRTKRRVVLTGYPLQNNLTEYWCMVDFVRPNYLGSKTEFLNMFERPIMNGQCIDSTEADIKLMRYRAHVLHSLLVGFVQRRSHTVLQTVLPQKEEYVLLVRLTPFQRQLYDRFMNEVVRKQSVPNPLKAFAVCCKIWNHPDVLYNFLVKRAGGEAVDLDLEEVASTVSGVSAATDTKPKRGAKPRKAPAKGRNSKPAASVTPYSNSTELFSGVSPMQPPASSATSSVPPSSNATQTQSGTNSASSFPSTVKTETNYGPYTDEFNQPRTTFEGISQFFDDHVSQSSYDESAQFSSFGNDVTNFNPSSKTDSSPATMSNVTNSLLQQPTPASSTSLFNLDNQNTVTVSNSHSKTTPSSSVLPSLPSGISLTPISARNQANNAGGRVAETMDVSSTDAQREPKSVNATIGSSNSPQASISQNPVGSSQNYLPGFGLEFWDSEKKPDIQQGPNLNSSSNNSNTNPSTTWLKKDETGTTLMSSLKTESSNDSKPKINIISDIKLPPGSWPDKKINIISNIKIEPKKEEDDKLQVKRELEMIKNELKNELKIQDDPKPPAINESPLAKLASLSPLKDSKEDSGIPYDWALDLLKDYVPGMIENGAKFQILFCIIKESLALGDRLLVFSQSLITLDLIEQFLQSSEIPGDTQKWARNVSYYRLDGSTLAQEREKLINEFNSNAKIHLFLVSTRAGSLGINLIGANRVVVLDASWNPCHDTQAVCRVYRYGQRKPCFVYRLVVDNCLEKKIYDRQVSKQGMSDRVVDECNPDAHLTIKDVSTLCFDDKKDEGEIKDWSCCKDKYIDVVLQKVLERHGTTLTKEPFQHESLLVDRKEKQLSQQEKRLAKKGYEREKNAARQPSYLSGSGRGQRPIASVRPMQQGGERPSRWIPAEHWQRQGMTAQEMTLPLDVVIPTNQPEKGNIVLKAGQKVLVLKSPKGVYMQLESGKIVAIKTAIKVKGKADDNSDPMKALGKHAPPFMPPHMKGLSPMPPTPKRSPKQQGSFMPGMTKMNIKSVQKTVPNLVSKIQSVTKRMQSQPDKSKAFDVGSEIVKSLREGEPMPGSSSEDEHPPLSGETPLPTPLPFGNRDGADELEKKISQLKKNISIQRVTSGGVKQPLKSPQSSSQSSAGLQAAQQRQTPNQLSTKLPPGVLLQDKLKSKQTDSILDRLGQSTSSMDTTPFQETLDSITAGFKNPDNLDQLDSDEEEDDDEDRPPMEEEDDLENEEKEEALTDDSMGAMKHPMEMGDEGDLNDSDDVTYISEQPSGSIGQPFSNQQMGVKPEGATNDFSNSANANYGYNYNYNVPPYQNHPPPQGYTYPPQPPPPFDGYSGYPHGQPPYNYGYQGYPPPQPHYPPPPPQTGYDYNNPPPVYPNYPYPQQYAPPPQGIYPPPTQTAPPATYTDYSQYPNQSQQSSSNYYQNN